MIILSGNRTRKIEQTANAQGLSYEQMMENAGKGCADFILSRFVYADKLCILCGKGKNGGDGFVTARYLAEAGRNVTVIKLFNCPSDDLSEKNKNKLPEAVRLLQFPEDGTVITAELKNADVLVDAVFGIGFQGSLPESIKPLFALCNVCKASKVAIDIPSGLTLSQLPEPSVIKADHTLSMLALKPEHVTAPHRAYCGSVNIIPIGITVSKPNALSALTAAEAAQLLPKRPFNAHKGTCGRALIIGGSKKMPGAAVLAAKGALSSGAGLVQLAFPDCCVYAVQTKLTESIFLPLPCAENGEVSADGCEELSSALAGCSAAAIGCGLGQSENSAQLLLHTVKTSTAPLILDADGINILARHKDILKEAVCPVMITPHPGEMARLTGLTVQEVNAGRTSAARIFAEANNVTVLLKGENTVIASPDGRVCVNASGCSALARGGSGDLLTGIAVSLLAQGLAAFDALCLAAYVHGLAGELAAEKYTPYAANTEKLIDCIPDAFLKISESK